LLTTNTSSYFHDPSDNCKPEIGITGYDDNDDENEDIAKIQVSDFCEIIDTSFYKAGIS